MYDLDFAPPEELTLPLWRSLVLNVIDRVAPERLPPLQLTSKPVDVGILLGDLVELPWYRTVFSNLADVISPELQPPLQLESRPIDVGELLGDALDHGWWDSLLGNVRDRMAPEKLPPLELTSQPVASYEADTWLQILDWSSLLDTPKVYLPDAPQAAGTYTATHELMAAPVAAVPANPEMLVAEMQFKRDISRSRLRQKIWMSLVAAEVAGLVVAIVKFS
jgi:hypothetical protein